MLLLFHVPSAECAGHSPSATTSTLYARCMLQLNVCSFASKIPPALVRRSTFTWGCVLHVLAQLLLADLNEKRIGETPLRHARAVGCWQLSRQCGTALPTQQAWQSSYRHDHTFLPNTFLSKTELLCRMRTLLKPMCPLCSLVSCYTACSLNHVVPRMSSAAKVNLTSQLTRTPLFQSFSKKISGHFPQSNSNTSNSRPLDWQQT
jgi:hypothetical protein